MAYLKSTEALVHDRLNAPIGTKMIFNQTASPTGWAKVTGTGNDTALRVTTGTVGTGGTVAFETAFASQTPTISMTNAAVTLTTAQTTSHNHGWSFYDSSSGSPSYPIGNTGNRRVPGDGGGLYGSTTNAGSIGATGSGQAHTHTNSASSSAVDMNVSYVDVIIATKE